MLSVISPAICVSPYIAFNVFHFPTQDIQCLSAEEDHSLVCILLAICNHPPGMKAKRTNFHQVENRLKGFSKVVHNGSAEEWIVSGVDGMLRRGKKP